MEVGVRATVSEMPLFVVTVLMMLVRVSRIVRVVMITHCGPPHEIRFLAVKLGCGASSILIGVSPWIVVEVVIELAVNSGERDATMF